MHQTFNLCVPDQFRAACLLSNIDPQDVIQEFLNRVILPSEYYLPDNLNIAATDYFFEYALQTDSVHARYPNKKLGFLHKMERQRRSLLKKMQDRSREEKEQALQKFFGKWMKLWIDQA